MNILYRLILCIVLTAIVVTILYKVTDYAATNRLLLDLVNIFVIFIATVVVAFVSPLLARPTHGKRADRERGTVKWFNVNKGYGFVTRKNGEEIFVHFQSIRGTGRRALHEGQAIEFSVVQGEKGPQAEDVEPLR